MKISKTRNVGLSLSYIYFVLNTVIGIFMSAFVIRTVGKTDYGVYQSMSAFISYLVLLEFGTGTVMARNISLCKKDGTDNQEIQKNVSTIWSLTIILGIAICVLSFVFWLLIDSIYAKSLSPDQIILGKKLFVFAAINLLSSFLTQTLNGLILGYEYYTFEKTVSITKLLLRAALLVVLLTMSPSIELLVTVDTILAVATFLCSFIFCIVKIRVKFVFSNFDAGVFKLITPLALAMLLQTVVNTANGSVDKFLISIMMTPEDVAVYSVAMSMFSMFSSIATLPVTMFMPQVAHDMGNGLEGKELTETLIQPCRLNTIITGMITFGFLSVGRPFIQTLYGADYSKAWLYAIVAIVPMFLNMFNAIVVNVIDIMRKRHVRSLILMITTTLNIVLTIVGIQTIGMLGAALATGISLIGQTILLNIFYQKKIGLKIGLLIGKSFKGTIQWLLLSTLLAFPVQYLIKSTLLAFLIGGLIFVLTFVTLFLMFGANEVENNKVKNIVRKIFKKV